MSFMMWIEFHETQALAMRWWSNYSKIVVKIQMSKLIKLTCFVVRSQVVILICFAVWRWTSHRWTSHSCEKIGVLVMWHYQTFGGNMLIRVQGPLIYSYLWFHWQCYTAEYKCSHIKSLLLLLLLRLPLLFSHLFTVHHSSRLKYMNIIITVYVIQFVDCFSFGHGT